MNQIRLILWGKFKFSPFNHKQYVICLLLATVESQGSHFYWHYLLSFWELTYPVGGIDSIEQPEGGDRDPHSWTVYHCNQRLRKIYKSADKIPAEIEIQKHV